MIHLHSDGKKQNKNKEQRHANETIKSSKVSFKNSKQIRANKRVSFSFSD